MWKYVQLCLFLFNFAKYKQEKTEIGIKDYNSCDKLQNSLDSTSCSWINWSSTTSAFHRFENKTFNLHDYTVIWTSCSASKLSMFIESDTEAMLIYKGANMTTMLRPFLSWQQVQINTTWEGSTYQIKEVSHTNPSSVAAITVFFATSIPPILARSSWTAIMACCTLLLIFSF